MGWFGNFDWFVILMWVVVFFWRGRVLFIFFYLVEVLGLLGIGIIIDEVKLLGLIMCFFYLVLIESGFGFL